MLLGGFGSEDFNSFDITKADSVTYESLCPKIWYLISEITRFDQEWKAVLENYYAQTNGLLLQSDCTFYRTDSVRKIF